MNIQSLGRATLVAMWAGAFGFAQESGEVGWLSDLNQASALAAESGRPLMVVFR